MGASSPIPPAKISVSIPPNAAVFRSTMHHTMSYSGQSLFPAAFLNPVHQDAHSHCMVLRCHWSRKGVGLAQAFHTQGGIRQSNLVNAASQNPIKRASRFEHRKFDAR
jgi:uncharacterized iron-regulated protein